MQVVEAVLSVSSAQLNPNNKQFLGLTFSDRFTASRTRIPTARDLEQPGCWELPCRGSTISQPHTKDSKLYHLTSV
ncbi:MAG: hypothetical protein KME25_05410 [Symplocastrum torsivum CPER-KK1]|uniref:Uncharacterized protein n=1 Tax=Symplocastrum torsivum CPER-KK1 TaxID=450513 RepID=A0A951PIF9_9CYAN|nr:hypothetical protein [Symplocastrum torsivum CPER-KK1]